MFVGHALAAATAFSAFMLLDDAAPADGAGECGAAAASRSAGFLAGLTVMFEYQAPWCRSPSRSTRRATERAGALAAFAAGAVPPAVALGAYHTALFGRPWRFPLRATSRTRRSRRRAHEAGFHGLSLPHLAAFPSFLFSPAYGLFAFSPVLVLGLVGVVALFARRARRGATRCSCWCRGLPADVRFSRGHEQLARGLVRGPALHRDRRAVSAVADRSSCGRGWAARWWATAIVVGLTIPSVRAQRRLGRRSTRTIRRRSTTRFSIWRCRCSAAGYAPYGLGWLLHLRGAWALAPLAAGGAGGAGAGRRRATTRPRRSYLALGAAARAVARLIAGGVYLCALALRPQAERRGGAATATVRQLWEPAPGPIKSSGRS